MTKTKNIEDRAIKQLKWRDRVVFLLVAAGLVLILLAAAVLYSQGRQGVAIQRAAAAASRNAAAQAAADKQILDGLSAQLSILQGTTGPDAVARSNAIVQQVEHCIAVAGHLVAPDPTCAVGPPLTTSTSAAPSAPKTPGVAATTPTTRATASARPSAPPATSTTPTDTTQGLCKLHLVDGLLKLLHLC